MTGRIRLILAAAVLALVSGLLLEYRRDLRAEQALLVAARSAADSAAEDAVLQAEVDRVRVQLERARVRVEGTLADPHLAISLTDGVLTLERADIVLRRAAITADVPIGVHAIVEVGPKAILLADSIRIEPGTDSAGSANVAPRSVRMSRADFAAILPNVRPGLLAFLF